MTYNINVGEIADHETAITNAEKAKINYYRDWIEYNENDFNRYVFYYERGNLMLEIVGRKTHIGIFVLTDDHPDNDYFLWIMDDVNNYFEYIGEL